MQPILTGTRALAEMGKRALFPAMPCAELSGTFSKSKVATSTLPARRRNASLSEKSAWTRVPTAPAQASGDGSRKVNSSPSGIPARPIIRPSWPPPNIPTRVPPGNRVSLDDFMVSDPAGVRTGQHRIAALGAELFQCLTDSGRGIANDGCRQQGCINSAGDAYGQGSHRDSRRHLRN